jgi:hypothetical protein
MMQTANAPATGSERAFIVNLFVRIAPWLLVVQTLIASGRAFFSHRPWMLFEYDDFFYYLKVAVNLAHGHGSTYNGIVATNGYHPLWLLILTGLNYFTQNGKAILAFVGICTVIGVLVTYLASRRIMVTAGVESLAASALSLYVAVYACRIFFSGMEIVIAVPLALLLVAVVQSGDALKSAPRAFLTGLLAALAILGRLDSAILVMLLAAAVLLNDEYRRQLSLARIASAFAGFSPIFIYLWVNKHYFGVWMPISGASKQLRPHRFPSDAVIETILHANLMTRLHFLFTLITLIAVLFSYKSLRSTAKMVILPVLLFPLFYYTLLSILSDWWIPDWYYYAMKIAFCISLAYWFAKPFVYPVVKLPLVRVVLVAVGVFSVLDNWWPVTSVNIYDTAVDMHAFEATHPGIYAMGDRGGKVGYLLDNPMVQVEGLVMDKAFLEHIKRAEDLHTTLRDYNVRYYIATSHQPFSGCFQAVEPYQAGPSSPTLRGEFCSTPIAQFQHANVQTLVYDMEREPKTN